MAAAGAPAGPMARLAPWPLQPVDGHEGMLQGGNNEGRNIAKMKRTLSGNGSSVPRAKSPTSLF